MNDRMTSINTDMMTAIYERIWIVHGREGTLEDFVSRNINESQEERIKREVEEDNKKPGNSEDPDVYDCKKCLNRGYFWTAMEYRGAWQTAITRCACWKVRASINRMKKSGLAKSLCKLKDFEVTEAWQKNMLDTATAYLEADKSNGESFFIGGAVGSGKTFIGSAVCRELLRQGHEVIYMPWITEAQRLKALANDDSAAAEIATYSKAEYLYIDDLFKPLPGQTGPTPADVRLAYDIINYRYLNKLPIIITCEKYITELMELDEATISRIYERAKGYTVNVKRDPSRNYRMRGADNLV